MTQKENSAVIVIKTVVINSPKHIPRPSKPPRLIGLKPAPDEHNGISSVEQIKQVLRSGWPRLNTTGVEYDLFVESITEQKAVPGKSVVILNTEHGKFALTKVPAENLAVKEPSMSNVGCSGENRIVIPTPAYTYYISKIEKTNGKKENEEMQLIQLKNILRTGVPEKGDILGIDLSDFIEGMTGYVTLPGKSVIIMKVEWEDAERGEMRSGKFGLSKIPPEKLTDDSSLVDIGYDGNGKTTIIISKLNHYIFRLREDNGIEEEEPGLILDIDVESERGPEFNKLFTLLTNIDNEEVKRIIVQAEFKTSKKMAGEIIKTEMKEDSNGGNLIPYLEVETKNGKKYCIYLLEERGLEDRKTGYEESRGITDEYFIPGCFDDCVKINAGQYQYAVLISDE